ncbi:glycoside hydrolase family 2 TIM barrel-domain containing protein [Agromyces sp. Soil535]|uniref:glycoside hydrolase family 2 TIM barrel-domain containing protein n=1 Tax=Agromyces sp. Soil535 TaxID=1736390 RepID=UPI0007008113|nr:glycoside hydrolase family 2 TIM barrel-domain containing protein [Agromyces sp. Soil535]KRE30525.1 glycoside hydrolase [Agromyces sp. Soil535]
MKRTRFNDGWQFREKVNPFAELAGASTPYQDVALPHDATIGRDRDPQGEPAVAYFPGGAYQYRKTFHAPADFATKRVVLGFEGVYRDAMVYINGDLAGRRPNGYSAFSVNADQFLRPGEENEIIVEARANQDSRWYTGAGIYRDVWLLTGEGVHVTVDGLRVTTPDVEAEGAIVEVATTVENAGIRPQTVEVRVALTDPQGAAAASGVAVVTVPARASAVSRQRLYVPTPALWSAESPTLYTATAEIIADEQATDVVSTHFGIRRLQLDPVHGLRVNGRSVKLRGACIHHDNGILGSATFAAAEERRIRLLKEAGFNAIRSAHNPMSSALLDACDRLGMYVMDETFDMWTSTKTAYDYALNFAEWWERDVAAMVAKDFNHPCVIMYSIGNEIPETGSPTGGVIGRNLAEKVRELDPTRFVTNAVNGMLAVIDDLKRMSAERGAGADDGAGINTLMSGPGEFMNMIGASPLVTERTAESFGVLDVAGMNYLDSRYVMDQELFPNRIIVGTETFPAHIDHNWRLVRENPHVIGDFTWTGWDYLGEVGIGRPQYLTGESDAPSFAGPFPWIAAWCGDIDLTGDRRPASYYREIVFGLRSAPYIAVHRPGHEHDTFHAGPWSWSDSIASWTWAGHEGRPLTVEIYTDADEVELRLNDRPIARAAAGAANRYKAEFIVNYEPGELVAVAYRDGAPAERHSLRTASGSPELTVSAESGAPRGNLSDLVFVPVSLSDSDGNVFTDADGIITVDVTGAGVLQALGSGNPAPEHTYRTASHRTFDGRALAIIRPTGAGPITVHVSASGCAPVTLTVQSEPARGDEPALESVVAG